MMIDVFNIFKPAAGDGRFFEVIRNKKIDTICLNRFFIEISERSEEKEETYSDPLDAIHSTAGKPEYGPSKTCGRNQRRQNL